ncbi:MAG: hypothetical protein C4530_05305 [Desulfobacteraceae bacterium]|nr:MAG: hypothetical protein C4530_05305 [Desulfobacteraceae bacterium]
MERFIIHLNVADFAVGVERALDPRLQGRPVIIAPGGAVRASVYDMSEEAYRAGIRKGMPLRKAVRLCTDARVVPPHSDRYERAMRLLCRQALPYSPRIEPGDRDGHLFVDVTGTQRLFGPAVDVAWRLRKHVRSELNLDPIWSVAPNKLMAKVATRLVKPNGEYIVESGEEEAILEPLPIHIVPGIEREDLVRLYEFNLRRVFQVAALEPEQLSVPVGDRAQFIYEAVRGIDRSPVRTEEEKPPTATVEHTFENDTNDLSVLNRVLYGMIEESGRMLRSRCLAARRIGLVLDYSDGIRHRGYAAAAPATANDITLFDLAQPALIRIWTRRIRIRHMRLILDRLIFPPAQMELFPAVRMESEKRVRVVAAMEAVRHRFGNDTVRMGRMMV